MKKNIRIDLTLDRGEFTDMKIVTSDEKYFSYVVTGLSCPATLNETIGILIEQLTELSGEEK